MELERLNERTHRYNQRVVLVRAPYQKPTHFSIKLTNTKTDDALTVDELPDADFANWLAEFASKVVKYANEVAQHFKVSEAAKDFIPLSKTTD